MYLYSKHLRPWIYLSGDIKFAAYSYYGVLPITVQGATLHDHESKRTPFAVVKKRLRYVWDTLNYFRLDSFSMLVKCPETITSKSGRSSDISRGFYTLCETVSVM